MLTFVPEKDVHQTGAYGSAITSEQLSTQCMQGLLILPWLYTSQPALSASTASQSRAQFQPPANFQRSRGSPLRICVLM